MARLRNGRGENRSQILRPSSTAMKKLFQKSPRQLKGSGTRGNRRLVSSRGTGHNSSRERCGGSHFTGLPSIQTSSRTSTVRDQQEIAEMLNRKKGRGHNMISTGIVGT